MTVDGVVVTLDAYPGQLAVLYATPVPSAQDAQELIQRNGGSVLAQMPVVGAYLVGVDTGQEDVFLQRIGGDARIRMAVPNLVIEPQQAIDAARESVVDASSDTTGQAEGTVAILEVDCKPGEHAYGVATVLGVNGAPVTRCYEADLGLTPTDGGIAVYDGGLPVVNQASSLWRSLSALVAAADPAGPGRAVFINMSYGAKGPAGDKCVPWNKPGSRRDSAGYEQAAFSFWYAITGTLAAAFKAHTRAQPWVAVTIAAGNSGVPLDARMKKLSEVAKADAAGVLDANLMIVVQARHDLKVEPKFEYVETWTTATTAVAATENSWAAYGTSYAAPYALAQAYYRFANRLAATPVEAITFLKQVASSDPNHVIWSTKKDQPAIPPPKSGELQLSPEALFNCPVHSSWETSRNACVFGYLNTTGQVVCPVGGLFAGMIGPWLASVEWPSLKAQLGLGTPWIQIDFRTCYFERLDTVAPSGTAIEQLTSGYLGCVCLLNPTSDPSCSVTLTPYLAERRNKNGVCLKWDMCGVATAVGIGTPVQVNGYFESPIATKWPALPGGVLCQIQGVQICSVDTAETCKPCSQ